MFGDTGGLGSSAKWRAVSSWADGLLLGELGRVELGEWLDQGDLLDTLTDMA